MNATTMAPLLRVAHQPVVTLAGSASVQDAVLTMVRHRVGALCVLENGRLAGIFTERDLMTKVVAQGLDAERTAVREVMVHRPVSVRLETRRSEALDLMVTNHFRHLPVVDDDNRVLALVSLRDLLRHQLARVKDEKDSLVAYLAADGPGG
jgi:CBS domain-containing protein